MMAIRGMHHPEVDAYYGAVRARRLTGGAAELFNKSGRFSAGDVE
jgi:hypothetical protein